MTQTFTVTGMDCQGCVKAVEKALSRVAPQATIKVDLASGNVLVDNTTASHEELTQAVIKAGFGVAA